MFRVRVAEAGVETAVGLESRQGEVLPLAADADRPCDHDLLVGLDRERGATQAVADLIRGDLAAIPEAAVGAAVLVIASRAKYVRKLPLGAVVKPVTTIWPSWMTTSFASEKSPSNAVSIRPRVPKLVSGVPSGL